METLKSAQNKNAHLTSQIDQFKVEYKLRIDQMRADMILQMSAQSGTKNTDKEKGEDDLKDKKLNELERTIHALLRKMAEVLYVIFEIMHNFVGIDVLCFAL